MKNPTQEQLLEEITIQELEEIAPLPLAWSQPCASSRGAVAGVFYLEVI